MLVYNSRNNYCSMCKQAYVGCENFSEDWKFNIRNLNLNTDSWNSYMQLLFKQGRSAYHFKSAIRLHVTMQFSIEKINPASFYQLRQQEGKKFLGNKSVHGQILREFLEVYFVDNKLCMSVSLPHASLFYCCYVPWDSMNCYFLLLCCCIWVKWIGWIAGNNMRKHKWWEHLLQDIGTHERQGYNEI